MDENSSLNKENKNSEAKTPEIFNSLSALEHERALLCWNQYKLGRPSKYDEESACLTLIHSFAAGKTVAQTACALGICRATFYAWVNDPSKKAFSDTYKKGKLLAQSWFDDMATKQLLNPDHNWSFLLFESAYKRRFQYTQDSTVELPEDFKNCDYSEKLNFVFDALADGTITPEQTQALTTAIKTAADVDIIPELEERLFDLESKTKE
jgi:hypothetical protein